MNKKVLTYNNLPTRLPVYSTAVLWLVLDRLHVEAFVWGISITLAVIVWIIAIAGVCTQKKVDIFEDGKVKDN